MNGFRYFCWITGESYDRATKFHGSTRRRIAAFAIALHIPVCLWALTSYLIATRIFETGQSRGLAIAAACSLLIYLVERLVLVTPKSIVVSATRFIVGSMVAFLGAITFDLILFEREVSDQLTQEVTKRTSAAFEEQAAAKAEEVSRRKKDWLEAQRAAECEANGTCGSRVRSVGPVYREMARQADRLRQDYELSLLALTRVEQDHAAAIRDIVSNHGPTKEAGLLARIEAFHRFVGGRPIALAMWGLMFSLVLCFELTVVFVKLVFPETVDDVIERVKEDVRVHQATMYGESVRSPLALARSVIQAPI
jgi:hypothetical protein